MWIKFPEWLTPYDRCRDCGGRDTPVLAAHGKFLCVHCAHAVWAGVESMALTNREYLELTVAQLETKLADAKLELDGAAWEKAAA